MRRILSWIVLVLECVIFDIDACLITFLAAKLALLIYSDAGAGTFWVLVIFEGMAFLSFVLIGIAFGCSLVIAGSQTVWKSKKGARYLVVGIVTSAMYLLSTVLLATGLVRNSNPYFAVPFWVVMIIFGIVLANMGVSTSKEEGGPPTKREILEAKLAKLNEREGRNGYSS